MINLSLNELGLIAQIRNISGYENKSKEDLIKALNEPKPKARKPETKPKTKPKPETPKSEAKPEIKPKQTLKPEPKIEIKVNRKKFKKFRKDFYELRHKFSNKDEISQYRKSFYNAKKDKLFGSGIDEVRKNLHKFKKSRKSQTFQGNIDSVDFKDLDIYINNYDFAADDKYIKTGSIRTLFKQFDSDYYKPVKTGNGFAGKKTITSNI